MTIQKFEKTVAELCDELKIEIPVFIQEHKPEEGGQQGGFYSVFNDNKGAVSVSITICYWRLKEVNRLNKDYIKEILIHELQHYEEGPYGELAEKEREEERDKKEIRILIKKANKFLIVFCVSVVLIVLGFHYAIWEYLLLSMLILSLAVWRWGNIQNHNEQP